MLILYLSVLTFQTALKRFQAEASGWRAHQLLPQRPWMTKTHQWKWEFRQGGPKAVPKCKAKQTAGCKFKLLAFPQLAAHQQTLRVRAMNSEPFPPTKQCRFPCLVEARVVLVSGHRCPASAAASLTSTEDPQLHVQMKLCNLSPPRCGNCSEEGRIIGINPLKSFHSGWMTLLS